VRLEGMLYDYDDATVDVTIERELIHIAKAKRGKADGCMNNLACLGHREAFPHPVIAVSVWNSRVFVVDSIYRKARANGSAGHAVRYILTARDGKDISSHDLLGIGRPATLILKAPQGSDKGGTPRGRPQVSGRGHKAKDKTGKGLGRGEKARLIAAVGAMR